ncbi:MAG TPA: phage terminase large subunit family protein, partial [Pirellulales bacterium]
MLFTALKNFAPRERPDPAKWFEENLFMPDGEPWSNDNYPHLAAPGGPIEAFLDPYIRRIWLQFASRLSKTAFGIACGCYQAAFDPCPMLFGTSTKTLASRIFKKKLYPILDRSPLREELPAPHRRNQTRVDLSACSWYAAWSGSSSELADLAARYLHGNEIDKWDATLSAEADPLDLFGERAKEFPNRKEIYESTPGMKVTSRIERGRLASDNRSLWVPCPHCGTFQILRTGDGGPGGVIFDKKRDGHTDIGLAQRTARYLCEKCEGEIWDHQRAAMMRGGRWAKAGQKIIDGKCVGEPHY